VVFAVSYYALPPEFTGIFEDADRVVKNWHLFFCVACGLWGGLVIGIATEYFTSNRYRPVQARRRPYPDLECSGAPGPPGRARPGSRPRGCLSGSSLLAVLCLSAWRGKSLRRSPQPLCRPPCGHRSMQRSPDRKLALPSADQRAKLCA